MKVYKENPLFDPRVCSYKLSPKIRDHVDKLIESKSVDKNTKDILVEIMDVEEANKNTLDYESLVKLHKYLQRADPDYADPFYKFSDSCKCIEPNKRDNEELDKRLKMLRLKSSQAMYNRMTSSVDRQVERKLELGNNDDEPGVSTMTEFKNLYGTVIAVFNSFFVCVCTFIFCYKAVEYSTSEPNVIVQTSAGLFASTIVALAELYFLLRVV